MNIAIPGHTIGPFPLGRQVGDFVFLSGAGGLDIATGRPVPGGVVPETHQIMKALSATLESISMSLNDVVSAVCYLTDMSQWPVMNEVYASYFDPALLPARTAVGVSRLPNDFQVEITVTAYNSRSAALRHDR